MGIVGAVNACFGGIKNTRRNVESSTTSSKGENMLKSQNSLASQYSSSPFESAMDNIRSEESSTQSVPSPQRDLLSICSQTSHQSQMSLYSSESGFESIPLLGRPQRNNAESRVHRCIRTLRGHGGHVFCLATAGEFLYSGSTGNDIRVWRHPESREYCKFGHGEGAVKSLLVAGNKIYSAHQDCKIRVWRRSQTEPTAHKLVAAVPTLKDYLLTFISPDNYVTVRRHNKSLWIEHVDAISSLAVDKNGFLYSASWDRTVKIWRPSDFCCVESFRAHDDAINALVVSSDGFLYTGSADAKIKVWAKAAGERKHSLVITLESHKSSVNALVLSTDGSILYSGACDQSVIVWEKEESAQHMSVAGALKGHKRAVLCLAAISDFLCSGSADKTIRLWRRGENNSHSCLAVLEGHMGPVKSIALSLDVEVGCLIYSGSLDHDIKVWCVSYQTRCGEEGSTVCF